MSSSESPRPPSNPARPSAEVGQFAETLVAQWLKQQNWQILAQRWHCRWGELDLIALSATQPCLAFVEVKARSRNNWDADGLLAITAAKRQKLLRAAQMFLAAESQLAALPCRFDVAIVHYRPAARPADCPSEADQWQQSIELGQLVTVGKYCLSLQHYLPAAFDA